MVARAALESLLKDRKLDGTLAVFPALAPALPPGDQVVATGHPRVDQCLEGGWPRGHLSEMCGPAGADRAPRRAPTAADPARPHGPPRAPALTQVIRTFDLVLRAGGFGLAVLDLCGVPARMLKRLPFTTWLRLGRMVEGSRTAAVVMVDEPLARSAGGVSLELQRAPARWHGQSDASGVFGGPSLAPRLRGFRRTGR